MKYLVGKMNISEATRKAMQKYPHIDEYFSRGIINYRAMARAMQNDIRQDLGRDANLISVVTAIRRFSAEKIRMGNEKISEVLADSEVNLKYDIGVITARLLPNSHKKIEKLHSMISGLRALQIIQGLQTVTIVTEGRFLDAAKKIFEGEILEEREGLASIIVTSPETIVETPGVISHMANVLALERINIVEMMSSHTETLFIVDEGDALKSIEIIRDEIKRARV